VAAPALPAGAVTTVLPGGAIATVLPAGAAAVVLPAGAIAPFVIGRAPGPGAVRVPEADGWPGARGFEAGRGGPVTIRCPLPLRGPEPGWKAGGRHRLGERPGTMWFGDGRRLCSTQAWSTVVRDEKGPVLTPWRYP
jgi:hypothetical protein